MAALNASLLGTDLDVLLIHLLLDGDVLRVLNCLQDWTPTKVQDHLKSCNDIVAKGKVGLEVSMSLSGRFLSNALQLRIENTMLVKNSKTFSKGLTYLAEGKKTKVIPCVLSSCTVEMVTKPTRKYYNKVFVKAFINTFI